MSKLALAALSLVVLGGSLLAGDRLDVYAPTVRHADIYFPHPGRQPLLKYNHDVDIVRFRGKFLAAWNANQVAAEGVPGQFNFLSTSDDFLRWSTPVRLFTREGGSQNPVELDNQWQPAFINFHDKTLFCAWCTFTGRKTLVSTSTDGLHWTNREVAPAPKSLAGKVIGFPTTHGLLLDDDRMLFPCSLAEIEPNGGFLVGRTRYAAVLYSTDRGATWQWSEPIEAVSWSSLNEKPADHGGEMIALWEPCLFQQADGKLGLLVRNSTSQENPERLDKPHQMILYATSADRGHTWTKAKPIDVDSVYSRNFTFSHFAAGDCLGMVMNDWHVNVPKRIPHDRFFLSLFLSPTCDPDLLLPGPVIQPEGGTAYYPNGFIDSGKLYVAYTYPRGIHCSVVDPLPDFSKPFLLPRGGRSGLQIDGDIARFGQRHSSLGLVLTEQLTRQPNLRLSFDASVHRYNGLDWPLLTLGGKTRNGTTLRAIYSEERKADVFQVAIGGNKWADVAPLKLKQWHHVEITLATDAFSVAVDQAPAQSFKKPLLRKICFGGLYVPPPWPMGMQWNSDVRLKLESIRIE